MFCPACGTRAAEGATFCSSCGKLLRSAGTSPTPPGAEAPGPGVARPTRPEVSSYLIPSILVTIFCCLPPGIVAIVYAAQVNSRLDGGDVAGAGNASRNAKLWCWIGFAVGLVGAVGYAALLLLGIVSGLEDL